MILYKYIYIVPARSISFQELERDRQTVRKRDRTRGEATFLLESVGLAEHFIFFEAFSLIGFLYKCSSFFIFVGFAFCSYLFLSI